MTKWRILEFSRNLFQCFFFEVQTETAKTVQRQLHILHNISKFHHFVISSHLFYWHANHINHQNWRKTKDEMNPATIDFYPISLKWSKIYLRQEMTGYAFVTNMSRTWASPRDILISNSCSLSLFEASENIFESTCGTRVGTGRKDHIGIRLSFNDFTWVPKGPFGAVHLNLPPSRCSNRCLASRI